MLKAVFLAIHGFVAGVGAIELSAKTGSLALSLAIILAIYALVLSSFARLMERVHRPGVRPPRAEIPNAKAVRFHPSRP
jgi:hypothetical protein